MTIGYHPTTHQGSVTAQMQLTVDDPGHKWHLGRMGAAVGAAQRYFSLVKTFGGKGGVTRSHRH